MHTDNQSQKTSQLRLSGAFCQVNTEAKTAASVKRILANQLLAVYSTEGLCGINLKEDMSLCL